MIEARHESLYQRLKSRGLLDCVMRELLDGIKSPKEMARWLKNEGVDTSQSSVYSLLRTHGLAWRYDQSKQTAKEMELGDDMPAAMAEVLRRKIQMAIFEADGLKELRVLAKITGDTEKIAQAERKVRVAEQALTLKIYEAQHAGAAEVDAILADVEKMRSLQAERARLVSEGVSDAERIDRIRRRMYGPAAVALVAAASAPDNSERKEAA